MKGGVWRTDRAMLLVVRMMCLLMGLSVEVAGILMGMWVCGTCITCRKMCVIAGGDGAGGRVIDGRLQMDHWNCLTGDCTKEEVSQENQFPGLLHGKKPVLDILCAV